VARGVITTPMHAFLAGLHPLGRMGEVQEILYAVLYLESAALLTGETLHVDGAAHAAHWWRGVRFSLNLATKSAGGGSAQLPCCIQAVILSASARMFVIKSAMSFARLSILEMSFDRPSVKYWETA